MQPVLFEIPLPGGRSLLFHSYLVAIVLGFVLAVWVAHREAKHRGLPPFAWDFGLVLLACGVLGARSLYYAQNQEYYAEASFLEFFRIWRGGLVFYGGAISGLLGGVVYLLARRLPLGVCLDAVAPAIPVGMALGRVGCFLQGCCFGRLCDSQFLLGVRFPEGSSAYLFQRRSGLIEGGPALPVHPTQLYHSLVDLIICLIVLICMRRRMAPQGAGLPTLMLLYGVSRFCLEDFRADSPPTQTGLTLSQNVSAAVATVGLLLFVVGFRSSHPEPGPE